MLTSNKAYRFEMLNRSLPVDHDYYEFSYTVFDPDWYSAFKQALNDNRTSVIISYEEIKVKFQ